MNFCKDCKFLNKTNCKGNKSYCSCPKLTSDSDQNKEYDANDSLIYQYDEGGGFYVGDYFGCIHWANK